MQTHVVGLVEVYLYKASEGGLNTSIRGRLLTPAFFNNDHVNGWSVFILFNEKTPPGSRITTIVALLAEEMAIQLLISGSEFEFVIKDKKGGTGKVINIRTISDEEFTQLFHFDSWPGSTQVWLGEE